MWRLNAISTRIGNQKAAKNSNERRRRSQVTPMSLDHASTASIQNHLDSPFDNLAIGKERMLKRADRVNSTLGCFESAFGSSIITGDFTIELGRLRCK